MKCVTVVYPGCFQNIVDPVLFDLAECLEGEVLGSGMMMFGDFERDIDFRFPNDEKAKEFICRAEGVLCGHGISENFWSCEAHD